MIKRAAALFLLAFVFLLPAGCKHAPDKPQQSELLKALEIRPEDILNIEIRDDEHNVFILSEPEIWDFLLTYQESTEIGDRMSEFFIYPGSREVVIQTLDERKTIRVTDAGDVLGHDRIYTSDTPFDYELWKELVTEQGGCVLDELKQ